MKKTLILIFAFTSMLPVIITSCRHEPVGSPLLSPANGGGVVTGGTQSCSADTVYFQNKVLPLLISSCAKAGCHDAISQQEGVELTSYEKIITTGEVNPGSPGGSKMYRMINETDPDKVMPRPPSSPLTAAEKEIIYKWILQGAKNNACNDCDTATITYSAAVVPIINTNCKGCHNPNFLSSGLDLTSYTNVKTIALNGKLMGSVDRLPGFPAMPKGGAKLSDCKITQIRKWIAAGALNN